MLKRQNHLVLYVLLAVFLLGSVLPAVGATTANGNPPGIKSPFPDVTSSDPNQVFITYINQRGIISGMGDGTSVRPKA